MAHWACIGGGGLNCVWVVDDGLLTQRAHSILQAVAGAPMMTRTVLSKALCRGRSRGAKARGRRHRPDGKTRTQTLLIRPISDVNGVD